jgi:signal transduction histidine kinase/ActR/RegA family two-component response regulator
MAESASDEHEELERLRRELDAYRARFDSVMGQADGILVLDPDHRVLFANPAAEELYGLGALRGQALDLPLETDDEDHEILRDDGRQVLVSLRATPTRWDDGAAHLLVLRDVTDQRRAEARALAASRAKGEFLANMSHEIRTPINGILGTTSLLLETALEPGQKRYAELLQSSAEGLLQLIDDILDFSKAEAGKLRLEHIELDLHREIEGVLQLLGPSADAKGLELRFEPAVLPAERWLGDPARLRQVLMNLVGNAIKFTAEGRVVVRIEVAPSQREHYHRLRFFVEDTGIGIPPEARRHLFSPFTQAESTTSRRFGGTGLGLAICKRIVELMGGTLGVASQPEEGSTFWFEIPLEAIPGAAPVVVGEKTLPPTPSFTGMRLLLAEDNPVNQLVAVHQLRALGFEVEAVGDGLEAVEAVARTAFDVILMDCQMPDLDGYAATRHIREQEGKGRHTPIIAVTAHAFESDRRQCLEAGMDDYLAKPFRQSDLLRTLQRWLGPGESNNP